MGCRVTAGERVQQSPGAGAGCLRKLRSPTCVDARRTPHRAIIRGQFRARTPAESRRRRITRGSNKSPTATKTRNYRLSSQMPCDDLTVTRRDEGPFGAVVHLQGPQGSRYKHSPALAAQCSAPKATGLVITLRL